MLDTSFLDIGLLCYISTEQSPPACIISAILLSLPGAFIFFWFFIAAYISSLSIFPRLTCSFRGGISSSTVSSVWFPLFRGSTLIYKNIYMYVPSQMYPTHHLSPRRLILWEERLSSDLGERQTESEREKDREKERKRERYRQRQRERDNDRCWHLLQRRWAIIIYTVYRFCSQLTAI